MPYQLTRVEYATLNSRQKENYNYQKLSAVLAEFGYVTMRLSDDWKGADLIAQHIDGETFLKIQLKGRLSFSKTYLNRGLAIAFRTAGTWYLYPHDELLAVMFRAGMIEQTEAWQQGGEYHFPSLGKDVISLISPYRVPI